MVVRSEVKQMLILLIFTFMMSEVLTIPTLVFVVAGVLAVSLKYRPPKILRNLFAIGVFVSYWVTYGKVIDPEIGLNFLTTVIVLKLLEKEGQRDHYMIFFGLLLLMSAGSLFEKTLNYMLFFTAGFLFLIKDFYQKLGLEFRLRDLGLNLLWVLPLTMGLYFFVPRIMNPIPFQHSSVKDGEVGYTPDVNFSNMNSLSPNESPAFQAMVNHLIDQNELYWRGNTLTHTDGWNWSLGPRDRVGAVNISPEERPKDLITQSIRLFGKEDFFFGLDRPLYISFRNQDFALKDAHSLFQQRNRWVPRYEVWSQNSPSEATESSTEAYLQAALSKVEKEWIKNTFKGNTLVEIQQEFDNFIQSGGFVYSLTPGRITSFQEFMMSKRVGFCSHYASAFALILRVKRIPARLVSGFMGGSYNKYANFYLITQNDAHVWVEAKEAGIWKRLDPTSWIAPDRVRLGGDAFINEMNQGGMGRLALSLFTFPWLQDARQWFSQWDFKFYRWLEQTDYFTQEAMLERLNFKRQWFYFLAPILLAIFMGLYAWHLSQKSKTSHLSEHQLLWKLFLEKLKKKGLDVPLNSIREAEKFLLEIEHKDREKIFTIWRLLVRHSFETQNYHETIKAIKAFKL